MILKDLWSFEDIARAYGVTPRQLHRWHDTKGLQAANLGGTHYVFEAELRRFIQDYHVHGSGSPDRGPEMAPDEH